jgi:hypothetical protein
MFCDDDVNDVLVRRIRFHPVFPIEEHDDVRILFDRTGFAEIGEFRDLVRAGFDGAGKLLMDGSIRKVIGWGMLLLLILKNM